MFGILEIKTASKSVDLIVRLGLVLIILLYLEFPQGSAFQAH